METAAFAAAYLLRYDPYAVWRRLMAFVSEDLTGAGNAHIHAASFYQCWRTSKEEDNIYACIIKLCEIVRKLGTLDRTADELKCAAVAWVNGVGELAGMRPPEYSYDVHTGQGTDEDWWSGVNEMWAGSKYQADAMKTTREMFSRTPKEKKRLENEAKIGRQASFFEGEE